MRVANYWVYVCALVLGFVQTVNAGPAGFDAKTLEILKAGKIVKSEPVKTGTEYKLVLKAFYNKVSPEAYAELAVNYDKYKVLFDDIDDMTPKAHSEDRSTFTYQMQLKVTLPFYVSAYVYPEGRHTIMLAKDAAGESKIVHEITNYQEVLAKASQVTRLIPYETGMLVEDEITVKVHKSDWQSRMLMEQVPKQFGQFIEKFRKELNGTP